MMIEMRMDKRKVREHIEKHKLDVNSRNKADQGWTVVHYAAHSGQIELFKMLIDEL
jgi:ankyrin repeat protein